MTNITVIKSVNPDKVCKTYTLKDDALEKNVIANVNEGEAVTVQVDDAQAMMKVLRKVTDRTDLVLCAGTWHNAQIGQRFRVLSEKALAQRLGSSLGEVQGGVIEHHGELISARLKRGIDYSHWMLLDADNPAGIPPEWARMTIAERLELWEPFVKGITKCERIELRGSSARVHKIGKDAGLATHAWIRVSDPHKIASLKAHIRIQMVLQNAAFSFEKKSKLDGTVVGVEDRSVFDLAVMDTGRLVFCAKPEVNSEHHAVSDADIQLYNEGGGALDIDWVELPSAGDLERFKGRTGLSVSMKAENGNVTVMSEGELTDDTPIDVRGETRRLADWAAGMTIGEKKRCEAPFRVSQSEAAFIKIGDNGVPFVHDIGNSTTYTMKREIVKYDPVAAFPDCSNDTTEVDEPSGQIGRDEQHPTFYDWVYLTRRSVFRNVNTGEECKTEAFNLAFNREVPELESDNGRRYRPSASKYFSAHIDGRVAYDTMYMPSMADGDMTFELDGVQYVNSYLPKYVPEADADWQSKDQWKLCESHIKMILPDDWEALLNWMAFNVQNAGTKVLWSPIIKGIQGDGKSTLARILGAAMGKQNVRMISTESMQSDFNGWAEGSCVGVLEEIRIKGHNRHDAMNKLKPLVTNEQIEVVRKGQDGRNIPNCTNYMALTNHEDALVLDADDRRWGVFFTKYKTREQLKADIHEKYWENLNDAINNHGGVIRGWLMSIDLSGFNKTDAPKMTAAKRKMIDASRPEDEVMLQEAIEIGGFGVHSDVVAGDCLNDVFRAVCGGFAPKTTRLGTLMDNLGFVKLEKPLKWRGKARRMYVRSERKDMLEDTEGGRAIIRLALDGTVPEYDFV